MIPSKQPNFGVGLFRVDKWGWGVVGFSVAGGMIERVVRMIKEALQKDDFPHVFRKRPVRDLPKAFATGWCRMARHFVRGAPRQYLLAGRLLDWGPIFFDHQSFLFHYIIVIYAGRLTFIV